MNVVIFYFTGTGNTRYVSEYFRQSLNARGMHPKSFYLVGMDNKSIEKEIAASDIVFLAYPIYGSDVPENIKTFIENMPQGNGKKLGTICTQYLFSGDGASIMHKQIKAKGYKQMWAFQINMPNNLCMKGSPLKQSSDYNFHEATRLEKARKKIELICNYVCTDKKRITDNTIFHKFIAVFQRPYYRYYGKNAYSKNLAVDNSKCTNCSLCINICPNKVLEETKKIVSFVHKDKCTVCFRCINFCPHSAITFSGSLKKPQYKGPTKEIYTKICKNE